jgi:hypothetical protein
MIMWIPQLISCGIHMEIEILHDHAAPRARAPRPSRRMAPAITTYHVGQQHLAHKLSSFRESIIVRPALI